MWEDPIVKETRAAREELVQEFGEDLDALWEHLQEVQKQYQDRVVTGQPKLPVTVRRKVS
jgi:RNAse (barnase) inhibitor barstar